MTALVLEKIGKCYPNHIQAVQDFSLSVEEGEFIVIVGPSGCGKSTLLRMIAGLEEISCGELYIHGQPMKDVRPQDRDLAMVFQTPALYPHLSVYDNIGIGMRGKFPLQELDCRIRDTADILEISELLMQKPNTLSGGQKQRVALGRAIVRNASILLFDEPLSSLDARLRVQMRSEIMALHEKLQSTIIYVTHDHTEAMTMASRIVVMKNGRIMQVGTPDEIYEEPANTFTAHFMGTVGMNFLEGMYHDRKLSVCGRNIDLPASVHKVLRPYEGKVIFLGIRPENLHIEREAILKKDGCSYHVHSVEYSGHECILHGRIGENPTDTMVYAPFSTSYKDELVLTIDMDKIHFFDIETEQKII